MWKTHPSAGGPAALLPPGPTPMPTLSADIQEMKVSQILKTPERPSLRHSRDASLGFHRACLLLRCGGEDSGEGLGRMHPRSWVSICWCYSGVAGGFCSLRHHSEFKFAWGFLWLVGLVLFVTIFCLSCRQITLCISVWRAVFMLRSEMTVSKIESEELLVFLILTNITAFYKNDNLLFLKKNSALGHIFLPRPQHTVLLTTVFPHLSSPAHRNLSPK